jgi:protein gp37
MATKIEWATETWNPITGCTKISEGCQHCYAERMSKRLAGRFGYPADEPFRVTLHEDRLSAPLRWRKPRRVFVCSMGDLFHEDVPYSTIDRIWRVMDNTPQHTYLILTKRPQRMADYWAGRGARSMAMGVPFSNVWFGVTVENQKRADERIPILLQTPAAVRFVSAEPLLEGIFLLIRRCPQKDQCNFWRPEYQGCAGCGTSQDLGIDWLIAGAETGPGARPMDPQWAEWLLEQCHQAGTPFFYKRGSDGSRILDGKEWNEYPN